MILIMCMPYEVSNYISCEHLAGKHMIIHLIFSKLLEIMFFEHKQLEKDQLSHCVEAYWPTLVELV